jgi:DNA-binding transcriptional MerR regulator
VSSSDDDVAPQEEPLFGIGAVTRITGIAEATLRVWERRYRFPQAMRGSGGHRLYSQQDVLHLQWVKMHMDEGMRTGRAIRARHLTTRDDAVAAALHEPLLALSTPDPELVACEHRLLEALLAYDGSKATSILQEAIAECPLERVVLDVVGPTLSAVGKSWSTGQAEVATEHFATNFLRHQLLTWMRASPPPYRVSPIVLACAPEELHEGSLLMLSVLLRRLRWPVLYLGQSLPLSDLAVLADGVKPALIVFVAMSESAAIGLADWPLWLSLHAETQPPIIGYGGRAFSEDPTLADAIQGALLGITLDEGYRRIHRLMLNLNVLRN